MTQIVLIASALFIGVAIFAVLPEKLQFNLYKIPLITFTTLSCFTLSFRIKGRVLLNWILLLSGYFIRPKLYVFDKNDSYLRDIVYLPEIQLIKKKTIQEEKATIKAKTADGVISDFGQLEKILALHRGKYTKKHIADVVTEADLKSSSIIVSAIKKRFPEHGIISEEEKDQIIDNFQNFLNSLPANIQILIRVREVDIDKYLEDFTKKQENEESQVYKDQIQNYCEFISDLVSGNKILSRKFYVIIPYDVLDKKSDFELIKEQIQLRQDIIVKGLEKLGMKTRVLDSLEVLELFYTFYNPDQIKSQPLKAENLKPLFEGAYVN